MLKAFKKVCLTWFTCLLALVHPQMADRYHRNLLATAPSSTTKRRVRSSNSRAINVPRSARSSFRKAYLRTRSRSMVSERVFSGSARLLFTSFIPNCHTRLIFCWECCVYPRSEQRLRMAILNSLVYYARLRICIHNYYFLKTGIWYDKGYGGQSWCYAEISLVIRTLI